MKTFTLGFVTDKDQNIDRIKSLAETNNITELILRRFACENLPFLMDDTIAAPEARFSPDGLSGARRPSVLGLFDEEQRSKSEDDLKSKPKSPEPGANPKELRKRRSVSHLLAD